MKKVRIDDKTLNKIISESIRQIVKENEDFEELPVDNWNAPDEFGEVEDAPMDIADDDIILDPQEKPEDKKKTDAKRERVAELFRNILSKQGYKGEKLEREIEKRLGRSTTKTDAATRRADRAYDAFDAPVTMNGQNLGYQPSGGIYDDDPDSLYESVRKVIAKNLKKILKESVNIPVVSQFADIITDLDANSANFVAMELHRGGADEVMQFVINHMNEGLPNNWSEEEINDHINMQADY